MYEEEEKNNCLRLSATLDYFLLGYSILDYCLKVYAALDYCLKAYATLDNCLKVYATLLFNRICNIGKEG